jgi:putative phosphoesterase
VAHDGDRRPTRLAIITDVHADAPALRDALAQIERLRCDRIVCAGDLLDYGLFPEETLALLVERRIPCIRGNHDRWAVADGRDQSGWDLTPRAVVFLGALPDHRRLTVDGVRVAVWHARPRSDMDGILPDIAADEARRLHERADADVLIVGHTHVPFVLTLFGGGLIANPGALLRDPARPFEAAAIYDPTAGTFVSAPAPGGGTFGVLELPSKVFTVHRAADGAEVEIARITPGVRDRRRT